MSMEKQVLYSSDYLTSFTSFPLPPSLTTICPPSLPLFSSPLLSSPFPSLVTYHFLCLSFSSLQYWHPIQLTDHLLQTLWRRSHHRGRPRRCVCANGERDAWTVHRDTRVKAAPNRVLEPRLRHAKYVHNNHSSSSLFLPPFKSSRRCLLRHGVLAFILDI